MLAGKKTERFARGFDHRILESLASSVDSFSGIGFLE